MTVPTTPPVPLTHEATLGWTDEPVDELITEAIVKAEKEFNIRLYLFRPDPFNGPGYWEVTFRGSAENLQALYMSEAGGHYSAESIDDDMIRPVAS